jgi:phosphotransacetylase
VAAVAVVIVATTALARGEAATMVSGAEEQLASSCEPGLLDASPMHRSDIDQLSRC